MPRARTALAVLALAAVPSGIAASGAGAGAGRSVVLQDIAFSPSRLVVARGTTVTWRWDDGRVQHDVRPRGTPRFEGSARRSTGTHRVTLRRAGTYRYVCSVHPGMDGSVRVR
ncbi:MAG: blue (type 1) copper domain protein [Solirubrobacterales bacterium]|nr:blue (type 1) copper domain protein [Solirubrobacterales bacterium]